MPIGITPDDVFDVYTSLDEDLPQEKRVRFRVRAISAADVRRVGRLKREANEQQNIDAENDKLNEAILVGCVGWSLPKPFDAASLDEELTPQQKYLLTSEYPGLLFACEVEKKVSRLRQASAARLSARDASAEGASTSLPQCPH